MKRTEDNKNESLWRRAAAVICSQGFSVEGNLIGNKEQ
jgi:hypothetical protein